MGSLILRTARLRNISDYMRVGTEIMMTIRHKRGSMKIKVMYVLLLASTSVTGCNAQKLPNAQMTLTQARKGFENTVQNNTRPKEPVDPAPPSIFKMIKYLSPVGKLSAYLTLNPNDGKKHPAMVWITGGDCNSIGDVWTPKPRNNDQTEVQYRSAGIVMMYPSLRGGNDNPGLKEGFYGEVDDVIAAVKYLKQLPYVDASHIYLGGHSTGGTLAMLTGESTSLFRAIFAFGPVGDVSGYGTDSGFLPFDISNTKAVRLRSPGYWMSSVTSPMWVFEGSERPGNRTSVEAMAQYSRNPKIHFLIVDGANHFSILAPTNKLIAQKIIQDTAEPGKLTFSKQEVDANFNQ